ncbi:hypothetical protein SOASR030_02790 [Leminorella grimontii]|uniref:WG repeat-containing protein n=1 Tax=Leminorella grimontii TaxID=82981 RepID=A0AAV5N146_9GAMM|nr:hypothetical protein [Leminorella grimontii]KFC95652.1 hypothetical protein GLGR_1815 [Leminorella grimontii ATCC 33999 = DSM 5078]GKX54167.1 hypothetical protein SOASR030_02790 [Leminorella grimontii]VFS59871.1 Uncharacterised protein [Leminorella grimontii]
MKKYVSAAAIALLLSGCDGESKPKDGYYLVDDIRVEFDNGKEQDGAEGRASLQEGIAESIGKVKNDIYFNITPAEVSYYTVDGKRSERVKDGRFQVNNTWNTIKADKKGVIRLISDKDMTCGFYDCVITMTLKSADETAPELVAMKQRFEQQEKAYQATLLQEKEAFSRTPMEDFPGVPFSPLGHFTVKLPVDAYDTLERRNSGIYLRRMEGLLVDMENEDTAIYTFNDKQSGISAELFVVSAKKSDFGLASWLVSQGDVLFQSENGAVYYNQYGVMEVLYFQYDDSIGRYFVGLADVQTAEAAAKAFSILRTMDERYRGKNVITIGDLALSQPALEEKYQAKVSDYFNAAEVHQAIWRRIDNILEKPGRFVERGKSMNPVRVKFPSETFEREVYIELYSRPVSELLAQAQKEAPKGKRVGDVFTYGDESETNYDYYVSVGDGLTLKLTVPYESGNLLERMMFLHVFKQLDLTQFPQIPPGERKNLFKYNQKRYAGSEPDDRYFSLYEGLIDRQGNLIVPTPEDGYYEFSESQPFIVGTKWKREGGTEREIYRRTPEGFIFDEKGKLLLHTNEFKEIVEQHLAIAGDNDRLGLYDLKSQKWLVEPAHSRLFWKNGMFIASDDSGGEHLRDYLFDRTGQLLVKGKSIEEVDGKDRIIATDEGGSVSLMDKQGHVLFSHKGRELQYIPEIDAYALTTGVDGSKDWRLGIVSERGETIIPTEYKYYRVVQEGYLQMWLTNFKQSTLFEVDKVRHWRENQPLKGEPMMQ